MLDKAMSHQCTCPVGFTIVIIDGRVVILPPRGAPPPHISVGTVGSGLTGIEAAGVEVALMVIRPYGVIVRRTSRQAGKSSSFEILHTTNLPMQFAIDQIPVVTHLEHIGTLVETIPQGSHKDSFVSPVIAVRRGEVG